MSYNSQLPVQDSLSRWHRKSGRIVLWIPGTDHAGIATQTVVEKQTQRTEKKSRHDLGKSSPPLHGLPSLRVLHIALLVERTHP